MPDSRSRCNLFQKFGAEANKFALLDSLPSHRYEAKETPPIQFFFLKKNPISHNYYDLDSFKSMCFKYSIVQDSHPCTLSRAQK